MQGGARVIVEATSDDDFYSDPFYPEQAVRLAIQARVATEEDTYSVGVVLQGGWINSADQSDDGNFVDLDFEATITQSDDGVITPLVNTDGVTTIYAEWPVYRLKVTPTIAGEFTVEARVTEIG